MFSTEEENVTGSTLGLVSVPWPVVRPVFTPGTLRSVTVGGVTSVTRTQSAGENVLSGHLERITSLRESANIRKYPITREYSPPHLSETTLM